MSLRMFNHAKRKEPDEVVDLLRNVSLSPSKKVRASTVRVPGSCLSYLFHSVLQFLPGANPSHSICNPCMVAYVNSACRRLGGAVDGLWGCCAGCALSPRLGFGDLRCEEGLGSCSERVAMF